MSNNNSFSLIPDLVSKNGGPNSIGKLQFGNRQNKTSDKLLLIFAYDYGYNPTPHCQINIDTLPFDEEVKQMNECKLQTKSIVWLAFVAKLLFDNYQM